VIFEHDEATKQLIERVQRFMDEHVYPNVETYRRQEHEGDRWKAVPIVDELKARRRRRASGTCSCRRHSGQTHVDDTFRFEGCSAPTCSTPRSPRSWAR
jgi:acyl-CoA dehydrogenase